jgi:hypothetical protein
MTGLNNISSLPLFASWLSPQYENCDLQDGSVAVMLTSASSMQGAGTADTAKTH